MVTRLGRRAFEIAVGIFAVLGFIYVPLGHKTGFGHLKAILATREAKQAGREFVDAAGDVRRQVFDALPDTLEGPGGTNDSAPSARPHKTRAPIAKTPRRTKEPTPEVPKLAKAELADAGADASVEWVPPQSL